MVQAQDPKMKMMKMILELQKAVSAVTASVIVVEGSLLSPDKTMGLHDAQFEATMDKLGAMSSL